MKYTQILIFITFILLVASCASTKVISFYVVDEQQIQARTFSFYERQEVEISKEQTTTDSLIERTITEELIKKGYKKTSPSDMYISFSFYNENNLKLHGNEFYSDRRYGYPGIQRTEPSTYYITGHKEGVFLMEVYDSNDKLIWQGSKVFKALNSKVDIKKYLLKDAMDIADAFKSNS